MAGKVRFVKQYTINSSGRVFIRFESDDGRIAEINMRTHRQGWMLYTRAEAKAIATTHLYGNCGGPQEGCVVTVHWQ